MKRCPFTVRSDELAKLREASCQKKVGRPCNNDVHQEALNRPRTWSRKRIQKIDRESRLAKSNCAKQLGGASRQ